MKVLILAQYFPPDMGGGATRAYNMAKGLSLAGCDVTVVAAFPHYPTGNIPARYKGKILAIEHEGKLKIIRTYVPPLASEGFAKRVLLFVSFAFSSMFAFPAVRKIDVVWASNPNIIAMVPSLMYKNVNHCPVVQNVDDLWPEALYDLGMNKKSFVASLGEFMAKTTYRLASAITPISPAYIKVITDKYGIDRAKIRTIPAGVDLAMFSRAEESTKYNRLFRILYIGAFSQAYDFDQVFNAAKMLVNFHDIEFIIQGGGELASTLKTKINELKIGNVKLIDRIVSREEVVRILHEADVLLLPLNGVGSIEMGISSKLYEYQAARKPIICCSNGQPERYVLETKSGIVVKPGDFKTLAKAVITLRDDPALARLMGENGRKHVTTKVSVESIGLRMKEIFETLLRSYNSKD